MDSPAYRALLVTAACLFTACAPRPDGQAADGGAMPAARDLETAGRNVVLVLSDTNRLDHASPFSSAAAGRTPHVEGLAADGVRFTRAFTPVPISAPAYATLLTGRPPAEHGVLNNHQHLAASLPLLQERLKAAGYATAGVVGNPFCSAAHGFSRGFDYFWDDVASHGKEGEHLTRAALAWLDEHRDSPFFLFLAYMDAHTPFLSEAVPPSLRVHVNGELCCELRAENAHLLNRIPLRLKPGHNTVTLRYLRAGGPASPADEASPLHVTEMRVADGRSDLHLGPGWREVAGTSFRRMSNEALLEVRHDGGSAVDTELRFRAYRLYSDDEYRTFYQAGVRAFDAQLGRLLAYLKRHGLYDGSIVVFVSDHGEMLGERGAFGHVNDLYRQTLEIPLVVKAPGLPPGTVHDGAFGISDLHRLLLALAVGGAEPERRFPFAAETGERVAATYPPEAEELIVAVHSGDLKLISNGVGRHELYDLRRDPDELSNLYDERRGDPTVRAMARRLQAEMRRIAAVESLDLESLEPERLQQPRERLSR